MQKICLNLALSAALFLIHPIASEAQTVLPATPENQAELLTTLQSADASRKAKADACRLLSITGNAQAIPVLVALLDDESLSHMARYALEPMLFSNQGSQASSPEIRAALRDALGKVQGRLLTGVIGSLGVCRDIEAIPLLAPLLDHSDPLVAAAAARALGSMGTPDATNMLKAALETQSSPIMEDLQEGLLRGAEQLAQDGQIRPALDLYSLLTKSGTSQQVQVGALRGIILLQGGKKPTQLIQTLASKNYIHFAAAVQASQEISGAPVTRALVSALPTLPADHRILILQSLGLRGDAIAIPQIDSLARNGAKPVRLAALKALPRIGDVMALPVLMALLMDSDADIATTARECLAALPGDAVDSAVTTLLSNQNAEAKAVALELMGHRRMTGQLPAIREAAGHESSDVRSAALMQIGDMGKDSDLPFLMKLLNSYTSPRDWDTTRQAVSRICARSEQPDACVEVIANQMPLAPVGQKAVLLRLLSGLGGERALQEVRAAVEDSNPEVHRAAIRALGTWPTVAAADDLLALIQNADNPQDRVLCLRGYLALASRRDLPTGQRLAMCRKVTRQIEKTDEKIQLLGALGSINSPAALALILPHLEDDSTHAEACLAIIGISNRLLKARNAARTAGQLIQPLETVATSAKLPEHAQQARDLLRQAEAKIQ